jgi:hypothetical protein
MSEVWIVRPGVTAGPKGGGGGAEVWAMVTAAAAANEPAPNNKVTVFKMTSFFKRNL